MSAALALIGCAGRATGTDTPQSQAASSQETAPGSEKMSLDAAVDEFGKVTLLDDETGKVKMVCKRVKQTGTRFGRKICGSPREWAQKKQDGRDGLQSWPQDGCEMPRWPSLRLVRARICNVRWPADCSQIPSIGEFAGAARLVEGCHGYFWMELQTQGPRA